MKEILKFNYWYFRTLHSRLRFSKVRVKTIDATIDEIISCQKSISRYGDGELRMMIKKGEIIFQSESKGLSERLGEVLRADLPNHIIGLPGPLNTMKYETMQSKYFWLRFLNLYGNLIAPYLNPKRTYGNAGISRFYLGSNNKADSRRICEKLKQIWHKKSVLIIEGEFSRMGVGNDLFDNSAGIERILCPAENAYLAYNEILKAGESHGENKLILIALGPTATILSYDLARKGLWALDIGHIDVEYMWMLQNATTSMPIKGRYVSEARSVKDFEIDEIYREAYLKSIIQTIKI